MQLRLLTHLLVLNLVFSAGTAAAAARANVDSTEASEASAGGIVRKLFKPKFSKWGFVWVPRAYYSSETSLGLGAHVLKSFRVSADDPYSDVRLKGRVTLKGQSSGELRLKLVWAEGRYLFNTKLFISTIPLRFYGIGPATPASNKEVYRPQNTLYYAEILRSIAPHFKVGLRGEVENCRLIEHEPDRQLAGAMIAGVSPSTVLGGGVLLEWDTRDRGYSPRSGSHHQAFFLGFDDGVGDGHDFTVYNVDLRRYVGIGGGRVLAAQAFMYGTDGSPPFWRLAALGGRAHSRGYRTARYLDRVMVSAQLELRSSLWRRLGGVVFAGAAVVGPQLDRLKANYIRPTFGLGLRLGSNDEVNARVDLAIGQDSVRGYVTLDEAF
ncbi:MAG: BamA/TamA family outer membrane protein [Candidatus Krumholzibacteria bacterium]|nr:BamA/TamA family outer membrane protein [Candidatus Krumholzibacteria bacterium]